MPSTVIASYHYEPSTLKLRVVFLSGAVYDYLKVPQEVYDEMKASFSKGEFLNTRIKNQYSFKKIK